MAERVLKLKALHCNHRSSGSLIGGQKSSILRISKHKKHLSVRFEDQVPMASIKTLINDIDKISTNIECYFPSGYKGRNLPDMDENIVIGFGDVKKSCVKRKFEGNNSLNEFKGIGKVTDKGSALRNNNVGNNKMYKNLAGPQDSGDTEFRVVKKKILPTMSHKVFKHYKSLVVGHGQGYYHPSPKIVKQSVHPSVLKKNRDKRIPLFKDSQNGSI